MKATISNLQIRGVSAAIPGNVFDLRSLEGEFGVKEIARIIKATGIEKVRIANPGVCTSDLCEAAARQLMERLSISSDSIDGIVFVSQTPDYIMPATSVMLQHKLGLATTTAAFDINYGCSGYIYGLYQAAMMIAAGGCRRVLVCAGDVLTPFVHSQDRANRLVFGDGGSATIVETGDHDFVFDTYTDGAGWRNLIIPAGGARIPRTAETAKAEVGDDGNLRSQDNVYMSGMKILNFAINVVPDFLTNLLELSGWSRDELDLVVLHQANKFMVSNLRRMMELKKSVAPYDCSDVGNTGPASIPLLMSLRANELADGRSLDKTVLCGFGVGYSVSGACVPLTGATFCEPVTVDEATPMPDPE